MQNQQRPSNLKPWRTILLITIAILAYMFAALPAIQRRQCLKNLHDIEISKQAYIERPEMPDDYEPRMNFLRNHSPRLQRELACPLGGTYRPGTRKTPASCTVTNRMFFNHVLPKK